ncbi:hypothetical protein Cs7R123_50440 [Catellatospora sp. TT07R-123]|nr:hypothetical protein Cs7R123_50440 [Catellatospora sp. TT07R-123]
MPTVATAVLCWPLGIVLGLVAEPWRQSGGIAAYLLIPLAVLAAWSLAVWRWPWRPTGFQVLAGSFTATQRWPNGGMFTVGGYLAAPHLAALSSSSSMADAVGTLADIPVMSVFMLIIPFLQPRLVLTPAGLECPGLGFIRTSWDGITSAEFVKTGPRAARGVRLTLVGPNRRERAETIPRGFAVDYMFLTAAIRHYLDHPEHRAAIGTAAESQRLKSIAGAPPEHDGERALTE